jgi:chromate transporter
VADCPTIYRRRCDCRYVPGPIATNTAVFVGYKTAGLVGAIVSILAISLPSLFLIIIVAMFFYKMRRHPMIQSAFYGLRPVIVGLILYAAIRFAINNEVIGGENWVDGIGVLIILSASAILLFTKTHPVFVILLSGIVGVIVYS